MNSSFKNLGISPPILQALEEMGFEEPTEVQSRAIPHILKQEDLIVISKTGSGKTAVFGVPMLQMTNSGAAGPQGLILTPTRELAVQVDSDLKKMSKYLQHKTTAIYGQHSMNVEIQALNKGVSIITGTPGRVYDHIQHRNLDTKHIRFLVLDEADRMLDMGFLDQVARIIKTLPKDRVTLLFSATIPAEIQKICREHMKHPVTVEIESQTKTVDTTQQIYYRVNNNEKNTQLNRLLLLEQPESCMIFCNTRFMVDRIQSFLSRKGYAIQALHGDIPQIKRLKTLQQFKQGEFHLLVATDVAARGIHIDDLSLVINYDIPLEKDGYVHRIGRTGRAGNGGRAISLVTSDDIMSLYEIEEHIGAMIVEAEFPPEAFFNENSASIEKWIQMNSEKSKLPQAASVSKLTEAQNKSSQPKPPQHQEKQRNQSSERNTAHKVSPRVNIVHSAEQAQPIPTMAQPVSPLLPEADSVHAQSSPEIKQRPDYNNQSTTTTIFYLTGTGNSLWAARNLARELGNTELISMINWKDNRRVINSKVIGLVFPVHIWGVPRRVLEFLDELHSMSPEYIFAVASNAGQVSNTLVQLKKVMESKGLVLSGGWSVVLPSNYIPWGGPGLLEEQNVLFKDARIILSSIAFRIRGRLQLAVDKGPLWQRVLFTGIYKMTYSMVPRMDDKFWVDERCNQCGICVKICPVQNIEFQDEKLVWNHGCEQCFACLQWCPQEALQYGKKTPAYDRYHHPEIKVRDLMKD